jgi:hypothetical protein
MKTEEAQVCARTLLTGNLLRQNSARNFRILFEAATKMLNPLLVSIIKIIQFSTYRSQLNNRRQMVFEIIYRLETRRKA